MPFNGSGLFTRAYNWVNDAANAIPITASRMDADSNDFAAGLSNCLTRDGQAPASLVTTPVINSTSTLTLQSSGLNALTFDVTQKGTFVQPITAPGATLTGPASLQGVTATTLAATGAATLNGGTSTTTLTATGASSLQGVTATSLTAPSLISPGALSLTGTTVTAPTPTAGDNSTSVATTAFVQQSVSPISNSAAALLTNKTILAATNTVEATSGPTGSPFGWRNKIVNGSCVVQQSFTTITQSAAGTTYTGPDQFAGAQIGTPGGSFAIGASSLSYNGVVKPTAFQQTAAAITNTTLGNSWAGIQYPIEGFNVYPLLGQPVTLSFIFAASIAGTYSVSIRDGSTSNSFVTSFTVASNIATRIVLPIATLPTTLSVPNSSAAGLYINIGAINTGTYQATTLNAWTSGSFSNAPGAVNWGATVGATIALTDLQLEAGTYPASVTPSGSTPTVAVPVFESRPYQVELALCQRYYNIASSIGSGFIASANIVYSTFYYVVPMRAIPTVLQTTAAVVNTPSAGNFTQSAASAILIASSNESAYIQYGNFTGLTTVFGPCTIDGGVISFSARL